MTNKGLSYLILASPDACLVCLVGLIEEIIFVCSVCYDVHLFHIHQNQQHAVLMDQFVIARVLCMKMFGYLSKKNAMTLCMSDI